MIIVKDLHKSFPMGEQTLTVLRGIDLTIERGELIYDALLARLSLDVSLKT